MRSFDPKQYAIQRSIDQKIRLQKRDELYERLMADVGEEKIFSRWCVRLHGWSLRRTMRNFVGLVIHHFRWWLGGKVLDFVGRESREEISFIKVNGPVYKWTVTFYLWMKWPRDYPKPSFIPFGLQKDRKCRN